MMKYIIICLLGILFFSDKEAIAQNQIIKKDTIYYLLDTANTSIKDRMFKIEREGPAMIYQLKCKCYPYSTNITFYFDINHKKEKKIKPQEFNNLSTVSISQLIEIAVKLLAPNEKNKYKFMFIEPIGSEMRLIDMTLAAPYNPRKVQ
jgi:hypothetical protein